jgi:MFS family permease
MEPQQYKFGLRKMKHNIKAYYKGNKGFVLVSLVVMVLKVWLAITIELGNDEVYYTLYARNLSWSYFDHPPIIGWMIWVTTLGNLLHGAVWVRLGALIMNFATAILLYQFVQRIYSKPIALIAVVLFYSSFYFTVISGIFLMPDAPLVFFSMLALYFIWPSLRNKEITVKDKRNMLLTGLFVGLAFLSKYSGLYLWGGVGMYILLYNRKWLKQPAFYTAILITIICTLPVFLWNWQHGFESFTFHGNRVNEWQGIHYKSLRVYTLGQVLYQNPLLFSLLFSTFFIVIKDKSNKALHRLLFWMGFPTFFLFLIFSSFRDTFPHWSGPVYLFFIIYAASKIGKYLKAYRIVASISYVLVLLVLFLGYFTINWGWPVEFRTQKDPDSFRYGRNDFTLDMYGWRQAGDKIKQHYDLSNESKVLLLAKQWYPAGHIDYYIAQPNGWDATVIGSVNQMHQFKYYNYKYINNTYDTILFVTTSHYFFNPASLKKDFMVDSLPQVLNIERGGKTTNYLYVYGVQKKDNPEVE